MKMEGKSFSFSSSTTRGIRVEQATCFLGNIVFFHGCFYKKLLLIVHATGILIHINRLPCPNLEAAFSLC